MLALLLILAALVPGEWEYRRRIRVQQPGVLHVVRLDGAALRHTRPGLPDLRVVHEDEELPFSVETLTGSVRERELRPEILNRVRTAAGELQFVLRLPKPERHSRLRIETSDREYRRAVRIETSEDGSQWDVALAEGFVLDFTQNGERMRSRETGYPAAARRFVRVTIADWPDPRTLQSAVLVDREETPTALTAVAEFKPAWKTEGKETVGEIDFGPQPPPWDRIRVEAGGGSFHRAARVEVSADGRQWRTAGHGHLARVGSQEELTLETGEQRTRHARVRVFNRDDRPLEISKLVFEVPARVVRFIPKQEGEYALWYGNAKAERAAYDLAIVLDREAPIERVVLMPGPERRFGEFSGPELPWTERHPNLFYAILTVLAGGIAVWTIRNIKKASGGKLG